MAEAMARGTFACPLRECGGGIIRPRPQQGFFFFAVE